MNVKSRSGFNTLLYTIGVGSLAIVALAIGVKIFQQWHDRQQEQQAFVQLQTLATQADHEACSNAAQSIPSTSRFYTEAQRIGEQCNFALGEALAQSGEVRSALSLFLAIPESAQPYDEAQALVDRLSAQIIEQAQTQVVEGKLDEAIVTLAQIPLEAPATATAQNLREGWRKEWKDNEETIAKAQAALEDGQWATAKDLLGGVSSTPYWQSQIQPLLTRAEAGIEEVIRYEQQQQQRQRQDAATQQATPTISFNDRLQSLYDTYITEGMNELEAWNLACQTMGGTVEDVGPEVVCSP
ncbi:MAG: hypothetical protein ACO3NK_07745 [Prochlorotrichaceae cyanobacterium]|jgi:hypothetical protein